jgi:hypothetical protein
MCHGRSSRISDRREMYEGESVARPEWVDSDDGRERPLFPTTNIPHGLTIRLLFGTEGT